LSGKFERAAQNGKDRGNASLDLNACKAGFIPSATIDGRNVVAARYNQLFMTRLII
jgi:hypothetical protein